MTVAAPAPRQTEAMVKLSTDLVNINDWYHDNMRPGFAKAIRACREGVIMP